MDKKEMKRKHIIEVALKLFIKTGFHGTPTSLIAKESRIATGTLFNYFETKDILINEIFKEIQKERNELILKDIDKEKRNKRKLKKVWETTIIWGIKNPEKRKFLEYFRNSYHITNETKAEVYKNYKYLLEIFEEIINSKKLIVTDELMLLLNFMGTCIFTGKYFEVSELDYDTKISTEPFERFCKSIELTDED